jgi:hypothetical protein
MLWFRKKQPPPAHLPDSLSDAKHKLLSRLIDPADPLDSPPSVERLHQRLLALDRLYEVEGKTNQSSQKKRFLETAAGASLLTGVLTITASQMPAFMQTQIAQQSARNELFRPLIETIAKDTSMDLEQRIALMEAIGSGEARYRTIDQIKQDILNGKAHRARMTPPSKSVPLSSPASAPK